MHKFAHGLTAQGMTVGGLHVPSASRQSHKRFRTNVGDVCLGRRRQGKSENSCAEAGASRW